MIAWSAAWLPNAITVGRLLLAGPVAYSIWQQHYIVACTLFALAGASDALDGWLARRFRWGTLFGAIADPLADKLLSVTVFVLLALQGHLPLPMVVVVVARDFVIFSGAVAFRLLYGPFEFAPTLIGKSSTACQVAYVLSVLVRLAFGAGDAHWLANVQRVAAVCVLATVLLSGIDYVVTWTRKAVARHRQSQAAP